MAPPVPRGPRGARLKDVAASAGVSVRTVSNVVNAAPYVAEPTRRRVQEAIDALGYRPNQVARQLRRGSTGAISLVVPELDSPYFAELAAVLVRRAERLGLTVHIEQTDGDPGRERDLVRRALGPQVDGVVFSPWGVAPEALSGIAPTLPLVVLGERGTGDRLDRVAVDNVAAAREATLHLVQSGLTRVAAIGLQPHLRNETAEQRLRGYRAALDACGLDPDPDLEIAVQHLHRADGADAVTTLLERVPDVEGLFCFTDQLALGAIRSLADRDIRVPDDVVVVGFDDIEDGRYSIPSLTTVAPDKTAIAGLALDRLVARISDPDLPPADIVAPHRLVVRESSGPRTG